VGDGVGGSVGVGVAAGEDVGVGVGSGEDVGVGVNVIVAVGVADARGVRVAVGVADARGVRVAVGVADGLGVRVAVAVGVASTASREPCRAASVTGGGASGAWAKILPGITNSPAAQSNAPNAAGISKRRLADCAKGTTFRDKPGGLFALIQ
jgi:hypothetical protein